MEYIIKKQHFDRPEWGSNLRPNDPFRSVDLRVSNALPTDLARAFAICVDKLRDIVSYPCKIQITSKRNILIAHRGARSHDPAMPLLVLI